VEPLVREALARNFEELLTTLIGGHPHGRPREAVGVSHYTLDLSGIA